MNKPRGIFSTAYRIHANNPCEDGRQRGLDALAKFGYGRFTPLPLTFCLENVGLLDTLFSLGFVDPSCAKMAQEALARFRLEVVAEERMECSKEVAAKVLAGKSPSQVDAIKVLEECVEKFGELGATVARSIYSTDKATSHTRTIELSRIFINTADNPAAEIEGHKQILMGVLKRYE